MYRELGEKNSNGNPVAPFRIVGLFLAAVTVCLTTCGLKQKPTVPDASSAKILPAAKL
jgi:hypothetical protein